MNLKTKKKIAPYLYVMPVLILLLIMYGYPLIKSIIMSLQDYKLTSSGSAPFNDFANFKKMFSDTDFLLLLKNSLIYVIISVVAQFVLGLILALCLKIVFLPWAFSSFVVGLMFRWSFNGEYGVVNDILMKMGIIKENVAWLGTPGLSLAVVIIAMIWMGIPFFGIMILAALQSVPDDIYEAADIDGCGMFRKFFSLTLPYIKPTIIMTVLLRTIWIFNSFDLIVIITGGGPVNYSQTLPSYMYSKAFASYDFGLASAFGVLLIVILGIYAVLFLKLSNYDKAGDF